jgi:hypothetical protein
MKKKYILLILMSVILAMPIYAQALRNDGKINVSAGYLVITGACQNESAAEITLDGIVTLTGDWINNSSSTVITGTGTDGEVIFNGTSTQTIGGSAAQSNFEKLTINASAIVDVTAEKFVTVNGATANSGTLNLRSGSGGTSSFITGSASGGTTNAERYMTGGSGSFWHNASSPVSGQKIINLIFRSTNSVPIKYSAPDSIRACEFYAEATGKWTYFTDTNLPSGSATTFTPGIGYMLRRTGDGVITFSGSLNAGSISPSVTRSRNGWNAVGNPYSSSIGLTTGSTSTNFLGYNIANLDGSYAAAYFWNGTSYTIQNYTTSGIYIQPGQGFIVKAAAAGSVGFTSAMQAHGNPAFYKKSFSSPWDEIVLNVKAASDSASTKILFRDDMTRGLDVLYDAGQFGGNPKFLLYTKLVEDNGVDFAIQCLSSMETDSLAIPIGFDCSAGGLVSFNAEISSLPSGYIAVLEDRLPGTFTDLNVTNAKYEVAVEAGTTGFGRFFLHSIGDPTGLNLQNKQKITSFAVKKEIYIKGLVSEGSMASIYDIMGRKMGDFRLEPSDMNIINAGAFIEGVYIVKVSDKGVLKTDRVVISE